MSGLGNDLLIASGYNFHGAQRETDPLVHFEPTVLSSVLCFNTEILIKTPTEVYLKNSCSCVKALCTKSSFETPSMDKYQLWLCGMGVHVECIRFFDLLNQVKS